MRIDMTLQGGTLDHAAAGGAPIVAYVAPDAAEVRALVETYGLDPYDIESALDPDEVPRLEHAGDRLSIVWQRPKRATVAETLRFEVSSVGLFLTNGRLVAVVGEEPVPFGVKDFQGAAEPADVLLRSLLHSVRHFVGHLKAIRQVTSSLEAKISSSMENRYLLQMFSFSESLTYYLNAIEGNGAVLHRLRALAQKVGFAPHQLALLDDLLLENEQCARQAQIHSSVLAGLMDARGTIVSNNVNTLLKNLTLINIIFLPLNLLASIGGMSEYSMMTRGVDWRSAYVLLMVGMVVLGWLTWYVVVRATNRPTRRLGARVAAEARARGSGGAKP